MKNTRILLIEDEEGLVLSLEDRLRGEGYIVESRTDGKSGEEEAMTGEYDLIILDVMLPERDGFQVAKNLKDAGITTPILMLTARSSTLDTVLGLRIGADDYLTKPFDAQELSARMYALLRRSSMPQREPGTESDQIRFGDFLLDTKKQELSKSGETIPLNTHEYLLLKFLAENPNRVVSRDEILDEVWGYESETTTRTIDVHIAWLRKKLGETEESRHLITIRGRGYRFDTG
ncbi:MAG TPA: response regulator transcription factor [Spirochaetia bacterium]|nr:response regulator transcription factor [Spirochaetia bacterium]